MCLGKIPKISHIQDKTKFSIGCRENEALSFNIFFFLILGSQKPAEPSMGSECEKLASLVEGDLVAAPVTPQVFRVDSVHLLA